MIKRQKYMAHLYGLTLKYIKIPDLDVQIWKELRT